MRSLLIILAAAMLTGPAAIADPGADLASFASELQRQARERAQIAAAQPAAPAAQLDIEDPFLFEMEQFAVDALRLSRGIEAAGGPDDLRCIFRGMSADAEARLSALGEAQTAGDQARLYIQIADLMRDAEEIAPAADLSEIEPGNLPAASCPLSNPQG